MFHVSVREELQMSTGYPIPLAEFKAWKRFHEERGHTLLSTDDPRVRARGIVCIECQDWCKVLADEVDEDQELSAWMSDQTEQARCRAEDFRWERASGPVRDDDFSMTQNYFHRDD